MDENQLNNYLAGIQSDGSRINEQGYERYGRKAFDDAAQAVVDKLGGRQNNAHIGLVDAIRNYDDPAHIIMELDRDSARLERIAKMKPAAQMAELARIEAENSAHGRRAGGDLPAWAQRGRDGRVSDTDWRRTGGDALSDVEWSRQFDERAQRKYGVAPGRFKTTAGRGR